MLGDVLNQLNSKGGDLGKVVPPEEEGEGGHVLVWISPLAVLLGVVAVAETHGGPYLDVLISSCREGGTVGGGLVVDKDTN